MVACIRIPLTSSEAPCVAPGTLAIAYLRGFFMENITDGLRVKQESIQSCSKHVKVMTTPISTYFTTKICGGDPNSE